MNEKAQTMLDFIVPTWARDWLGKQRVEVILLFAILVMLGYALPYACDRMDAHIDKLTSASEKNLQSVIDAFEADQERDEKRNERKDELLRDLLQRNGFAGELEPAKDLP